MATKRALPDGEDHDVDSTDISNKRPRKETNASARRQLFVRSLPATATSAALTELFSQNYPLKFATVVIDTETKQSKGYGFVTFADAEDAQRALDEFNGKDFQGRKMKIEIAEPRSRLDTAAAKSAKAPKEKSTINQDAAAVKKARQDKLSEKKQPPKLIIRNLPWSINTEEKLAELFRLCGKVKHSTLPKISGKSTQAGFGFVVMRGRKNAERAVAELNGKEIDGRTIAVDWAVDKQVWEDQQGVESKALPADNDAESEDDDEEKAEGGAKVVRRMPSEDPEDPDKDLENFFANFGDALESEDEEEEAEEIDFSESENGDDKDIADEANDNDSDDSSEASDIELESDMETEKPVREKNIITDNSSTIFVRNLPFTTLDPQLKEHFEPFGPVRYARVVIDRVTERPKGTGFVCFYNVEDAEKCFREAPRHTGANAIKADSSRMKNSVLQDESADNTGLYTMEGRVLDISKAVEKEKAVKLTEAGIDHRMGRDQDKRRLYLLSEGTVSAGTSLYAALSPSEIKMREDSATQRKKLIQSNPTLHLSLTRLSVRNLPRNVDSKALKALARQAVVEFAKDVKEGNRTQLSKEEEARGGDEMREAEQQRKAKGKGIVRQSKVVFEGREGAKVTEESGAGRSRGYGFIEYSSHRWALMGLRWLNGHALESGSGKKQRLIVEFAIENAQVVQRRKEREEKARERSKAVVEAREKAAAEGEKIGKKQLTKDQLMAKTRKGQKNKKPAPTGEKKFEKGPHVGEKRKRDDDTETPERTRRGKRPKPFTRAKPKTKAERVAEGKAKKVKKLGVEVEPPKIKPGYAPGEAGRLQRRAEIQAKKKSFKKGKGKA